MHALRARVEVLQWVSVRKVLGAREIPPVMARQGRLPAAVRPGLVGPAVMAGIVTALALTILAGITSYRFFELPVSSVLKTAPIKLLRVRAGRVSGRCPLAEEVRADLQVDARRHP